MKKFTLLSSILALTIFSATPSYAQVQPALFEVDTPKFFISILAGVLLAIAFQVLLSALSVAVGISAIGNIEKKSLSSSGSGSDSDNDTPLAVKISSGVGIWILITSSISLFCASLLAVKLSLFGNALTGIVLGLVIWAAFFVITAYLEIRSVSSVLGSLVSTVASGIKSATSAVGGIFQSSPYSKVESLTENAIDKIKNEMSAAFNPNDIKQKVDEYVEQLQPEPIDVNHIKQELKDLLSDLELEENKEVEGGKLDKKTFIKFASERPNLSKSDLKSLASAFDEVRGVAASDASKEEKAKKIVSKVTPASEGDVENFMRKLEDYLRGTEKEELDPEKLKQSLKQMAENPSNAGAIVSERISKMDRSTLVALLAQNKSIGQDQAEKVAGYVEEAISWVSGQVSNGQDSGSRQVNETGNKAVEVKESVQAKAGKLSAKAEEKLRGFFDNLQRPELKYESLKWDVEKIMHRPQDSFSIIKARLDQFDRETLMALLTANDKISRQDVERIVAKVEETKEEVVSKAKKVEDAVQKKIKETKEAALHQAEVARKTAATAAWWLFATAVVSAIASAAGGLVALAG
jgi:hypothetical protein